MRTCKICGKAPLQYGFCIDDGYAYYCSENCLHVDYTEAEYLAAYDEDWAYWTEWDDE